MSELDPYRLPRSVLPSRYELELVIDPDRPTFSGRVVIRCDVAEPTDRVVLNSLDLTLGTITVAGSDGTAHEPELLVDTDHERVTLVIEHPLPIGPATIEVDEVHATRVIDEDVVCVQVGVIEPGAAEAQNCTNDLSPRTPKPGGRTLVAPLPAGIKGGYGANLRRFCLKGQGEYEGHLLIGRELRAVGQAIGVLAAEPRTFLAERRARLVKRRGLDTAQVAALTTTTLNPQTCNSR